MSRLARAKGERDLANLRFSNSPSARLEGEMRSLLVIVVLAIALSGCSTLAPDLQSADAKCAQGKAMAPYVLCLYHVEEGVFLQDSPENVPAYEEFAIARLRLAGQLDAGKITIPQFNEAIIAAKSKFVDVQLRNAQVTQQRYDQAAQAVLLGIGAAAEARANAGVARQNSIPTPTTQHTTCQPNPLVPSQTECTTTNY